jgi:hypothetical protein
VSDPKYPHVRVRLTGQDGNAFAILARVRNAMRKGGVSREEMAQYRKEATSGDYNNLLRVTMQWVEAS